MLLIMRVNSQWRPRSISQALCQPLACGHTVLTRPSLMLSLVFNSFGEGLRPSFGFANLGGDDGRKV